MTIQSVILKHRTRMLFGLFWLLISSLAQAADLVFTPKAPIIEVGTQITLSVSGTSGEIKWSASEGRIKGTGNEATYHAPAQAGLDVVMAFDSEGNIGTVKIIVRNPILLENAHWERFIPEQNVINDIIISDDGETLWAGGFVGLAQHDAETGEFEKLFTQGEGLPNSLIRSLLTDGNNGLWVGTHEGGLVHIPADFLNDSAKWEIFNDTNSGLPHNAVYSLLADGNGGIFVGGGFGLSHYTADKKWRVTNSPALTTITRAFLADGQDRFWIGTASGLAHYLSNGWWEIFHTGNSGLPDNEIYALADDGQGGIWIGTEKGGLAHFSAEGEWQVFDKDNSKLPGNWIWSLLPDESGGLWIGIDEGGLAYRSNDGQWKIFTKDNSELPDDWVLSLLSDGNGGILVGTGRGGLAHYFGGQWEVFNKSNSELPDNRIFSLLADGQGGIWMGTSQGGLAHRFADGHWEIFDKDNSELQSNDIVSLISDGNGGVWMAIWGYTSEEIHGNGGIAHVSAEGKLQFFNTANSGLPADVIGGVFGDGQGDLWVGTLFGLVHRFHDGTWGDIHIADGVSETTSSYPTIATALLKDEKEGFWMGSVSKGLIHIHADGKMEMFNTGNSELPDNYVWDLLKDGNGGLWMATGGGLAHLFANAEWEVFNQDNSPLTWVSSLLPDGDGGLWVAGGNDGTFHFSAEGQWENLDDNDVLTLFADDSNNLWLGGKNLMRVSPDNNKETFKIKSSPLPRIVVTSLLNDDKGGVWIGSGTTLAYRSIDDEWEVFTSELPGTVNFNSLVADDRGGFWVGTDEGLVHRSLDSSSKKWDIFNKDNSKLPDNSVNALASDEQGGVWIGTETGGLAYRTEEGKWEIFTQDNSELPNNEIKALALDGNGGVWASTWVKELPEDKQQSGLVHRSANGNWKIFAKEWPFVDNEMVPDFNLIRSLLADGNGGVWMGSGTDVFSHCSADGKWEYFSDDTDLSFSITLLDDDMGGVWLGSTGGLGHRSAKGEWTVFESTNSGIPDEFVSALAPDSKDGLWVGTLFGGLAHLTFGQKAALCTEEDKVSDMQCQALLTEKRAAIIIAGGGAQSTNSLWDTTEAISNRIYKTFYKRGFDKSELYYLSPKSWADFNGDGFNDRITRTPKEERGLTVDDVRVALDWAKTAGKLDQPLYLFFIDHGGPDKLQLAKNTQMKADEFKAILDDYQNTTGNKLVLVIEACYSGSLVKALAAPNRAIISSAKANELAYFVEKRGFTHFFADNILRGMNLLEAFNLAVPEQDKLRGKLVQQLSGATNSTINPHQTPQLDDNADGIFTVDDGQWLKEIYVNGNFVTGDFTLAVESLTTSTNLSVGQSIILKANASTVSGRVVRVWAVVRPPKINLVLDSNGTPILAYPRFNLYKTEEENVWQTTWNDAVYNGDYEISFYAEDNDNNIASSDNSVIISVTGGVEPPEQANVQIVMEKDSYRPGEHLKAELVENLGWGYDLYAAVVLPNSNNFVTFKNTNKFSSVNEAKKWFGKRTQSSPVTLLDFTLPEDLATGKYCLYGILSPEREDVFETQAQNLWVMEQQCFEIF